MGTPVRETVKGLGSLEKAMRVLETFDSSRPEMGLTEIAAAASIDRSAAQRILVTFERLGYLAKDPLTRRYRPTLRMTERANAYLWADDLVQAAMPRLIDLRQTLGETINFARLDGADIVYVARLPSARTSYGAMVIGRRVPALNTASGRAMVAGLPADQRHDAVATWPLRRYTPGTVLDREIIRDHVESVVKTGHAICADQLLTGEIGAAVAVADSRGGLGAIHWSVSAHRWTSADVERWIAPALREVANGLA